MQGNLSQIVDAKQKLDHHLFYSTSIKRKILTKFDDSSKPALWLLKLHDKPAFPVLLKANNKEAHP